MIAGMLLILELHTEYKYGFRDTVNIFLLPNLYLSAVSEAEMLASWWYTVLDSRTLNTYSGTY